MRSSVGAPPDTTGAAGSHDRTVALLRQGRRNPVGWIRTFLQCEPWAGQSAIVRSVFANPRTAVKASHATGKTWIAARIALCYFYLFPKCRVITTAPTWTAVTKLLWAEIGAAHAKLPGSMGGKLMGTELRAARDWFMLGISTTEPERMQGHHAEHILIILDEAPGVRPEIWQAVESMRSGGTVRVLAIGNPTIASGPFYEAFTSQRDTWSCHTISAWDTPNLQGLTPDLLAAMPDDQLDANPYPYLTSRRWVKEKMTEWGESSSIYQARVLGDFPKDSEDSLLHLAWLERARLEAGKTTQGDSWQIGVDVAGPGSDETVAVVRRGQRIMRTYIFRDSDPRGPVVARLGGWRKYAPKVAVDVAGIGWYMARHLEDSGFDIENVNVASSPYDKDRFLNLRAELWWGLRQTFVEGEIGGLTDEKMLSQLATIRYKHNSRGKVQIESKDEAKKRGGGSPDRADALMLAFANSGKLSLGPRDMAREILL